MSVQAVRRAVSNLRLTEKAFFDLRDRPEKWGNKSCHAGYAEHWLNGLKAQGDMIIMAAKATTTKNNYSANFKGFVNYVLTEDDRAQFKAWDIDDHDLFDLLQADISSGYKLSVSYNKQNDTYNATYMCNDETSPNAGFCLSAFAPGWYYAIKSLCYKHNVVLDCNWKVAEVAEQARWG